MPSQWIKSWDVTGSDGNVWKVSQRADGSYGCSCPAWKFAKAPKQECHHILAVRANPQLGEVPFPIIILANVASSTYSGDRLKLRSLRNQILVPCLPTRSWNFARSSASWTGTSP
jgi:hypothetical protein